MRIIFAGTPQFAVPCLEAVINSEHELVGVYTQPDRPAGRGRRLTPSPVKQRAERAGVPVFQPTTLRDGPAQAALRDLEPDLMVVVAYGLILPEPVLGAPRHGCWNVHASLLPRWRGAAPIQRAIQAGDDETGVCLMQMDAGLDTGPVIACRSTGIDPEETAGELHDRLASLGARLLSDYLSAPMPAASTPQPEAGVTYAGKLSKAEAQLDWQRSAAELARDVRAFNPWPVAHAQLEGERLRILHARRVVACGTAGQIIDAAADGPVVGCGRDALVLTQVQREGGRPISGRDYLNARKDTD